MYGVHMLYLRLLVTDNYKALPGTLLDTVFRLFAHIQYQRVGRLAPTCPSSPSMKPLTTPERYSYKPFSVTIHRYNDIIMPKPFFFFYFSRQTYLTNSTSIVTFSICPHLLFGKMMNNVNIGPAAAELAVLSLSTTIIMNNIMLNIF